MRLRKKNGFSYVIVMFLVAVISILTVRALENIQTRERRQKEAELLWIGQAYLAAIRSYYENSLGTEKIFPANLDSLLLDDRGTRIRKPLRRAYRDPMTNSTEWGLVKSKEGRIIGVFSTSTMKPIKTDGFPEDLAQFKNAAKYSDWRFVYQPK